MSKRQDDYCLLRLPVKLPALQPVIATLTFERKDGEPLITEVAVKTAVEAGPVDEVKFAVKPLPEKKIVNGKVTLQALLETVTVPVKGNWPSVLAVPWVRATVKLAAAPVVELMFPAKLPVNDGIWEPVSEAVNGAHGVAPVTVKA